jgi:hypothetical protein
MNLGGQERRAYPITLILSCLTKTSQGCQLTLKTSSGEFVMDDTAPCETSVNFAAFLLKLFFGNELGEATVHELVKVSTERLGHFSVLFLEGEDVNCLFDRR